MRHRVETVYTCQLEICRQTLRQNIETPHQVISTILKFYNLTLQSKAANTSKQSIYNLLHPLEINQFRARSQQMNETWQCLTQYEQSEPTDVPFWKRLVKIVRDKLLVSQNKDLLNSFYMKLKHWFENDRNSDKNKKLLLMIVEGLLPQLRENVIKLVNEHFPSSSSDPRIINDVFSLIENLCNHDIIRSNRDRLVLHCFLSDISVIALEALTDELIGNEQHRHKKDLEKSLTDMKEWKDRISTQIEHMHDSFEQGQNMAHIISEQIFKEIERILLDKILHEITEDIAKSQFINHEAVQNQAYEESFGLGNGEKILKYVLDINRYFLELSLREINTKSEAILHMHTMNTEEIVVRVFNTTNEVAQNSTHNNTRLIADDIERAIYAMAMPSLTVDNKFTVNGVMSLRIETLINFQQGFKKILNNITNVHDQVTNLIQTVKNKAYAGCKERISRRLGCQSRCPGCGSKCSRPEPHDEELFEPWHECKCVLGKCTCEKPEPKLLTMHGTSHHIAQVFYGRKYYKIHTPVLELCYQRWKTGSMFLGDIEVAPLHNFYSQYHPDWCDNLRHLSTNGKACDEGNSIARAASCLDDRSPSSTSSLCTLRYG